MHTQAIAKKLRRSTLVKYPITSVLLVRAYNKVKTKKHVESTEVNDKNKDLRTLVCFATSFSLQRYYYHLQCLFCVNMPSIESFVFSCLLLQKYQHLRC